MTTYKEAGVDVEAKNALLGRIKRVIGNDKRAHFSETLFKSLLVNASELKKYKEPMLAFNSDGAGTKTVVAAMAGKWRGIGHDIVNHCINDILAMGAKPLCFSDYVASDKLKPEVVEEIVKGVAEACKENNIVFVGGETAEMPSVYNKGETDAAGFIVGVVEKAEAIDGKGIKEGDALIGIESTGLHTNGFSLAREILFAECGYSIDEITPRLAKPLGEELLTPHRNYLKTTLAIIKKHRIKGIAHITGGSFRKNIPRILPKGLGAMISKKSWKPLPIFRFIHEKERTTEEEMYNTFNMGIGYVYVVDKAQAGLVMRQLQELNEKAHLIGKVVKGEGVRFVD